MGLFDIFITEREKNYRRTTLAHRFDALLDHYLSDDNRLESFMSSGDNGNYIFISYSPSFRSVSICARTTSCSHLNIRKNQSINLTILDGFKPLKNKFNDLKRDNIDLSENYYQLSDYLCDLITEAVIEFEKNFSLPKVER